MSKKRASDYERMIVNRFWDHGFAVMRAPSSSGTSKMPRPDVLAGSAEKGMMFAIEIKTCRQNVFYVQKEQIEGLMEFAERIGALPYLAVKFVGKRMDFKFLSVPNSLVKSKGDSFRVSLSDVVETGEDFLTLINPQNTKVKSNKKIIDGV
ncbi:MAG: Holliday junction resolvase [Candidatus Heimdallarchaeota archaeon]|nr:Holliday junction resolvase [Candidatus Heimdallarchaeota archaeon]MCK4954559.1 Holliday junction resolvase [Candidatus Heimdallarchaeota archaeon]